MDDIDVSYESTKENHQWGNMWNRQSVIQRLGAPHVERGQSPPPRLGGRNAKSEGPASCEMRWDPIDDPLFQKNSGSKFWTANMKAGNDVVVYPRFRSPDLWYHWHFPWPFYRSQVHPPWSSSSWNVPPLAFRYPVWKWFEVYPGSPMFPLVVSASHQGLLSLVQNAAKLWVLIAQWEYPGSGSTDSEDHRLISQWNSWDIPRNNLKLVVQFLVISS